MTQPRERKPTTAQRRAFISAANRLAKIGASGVYIYLEEDHLCLMHGPSHNQKGEPQQHNIIEQVRIPLAGGGGW